MKAKIYSKFFKNLVKHGQKENKKEKTVTTKLEMSFSGAYKGYQL
jgi:hypothetical protein